MDLSFRSSPPILAAVDRLVADLGHDALGLPRRPNPHTSRHLGRAGSVTLWLPFTEDSDDEEEAGEEGWISDAVRRYAARLARQVRIWLDDPFLVESRGRALRPEDILILVRRRGALAALLVARLHAEGVPVAGVDRLLLSAPLAVQDLLAAARFAAQPLDDLNLASLLVSPLFGWSQDDLFEAAHARSGPALAAHSRIGARGTARDPRDGRLCDARTASSRRSCRGRSTGVAGCSSGSAPRRATRSRNCSPRRSTSRAMPPPRSRPFSTGSRAAMSRSCAILRRRSMRCG